MIVVTHNVIPVIGHASYRALLALLFTLLALANSDNIYRAGGKKHAIFAYEDGFQIPMQSALLPDHDLMPRLLT